MKINYSKQYRIELESYIIGSILIEADNHIHIRDIMFKHGYDKPDVFITEFHNDVYEAILKCWESGIPADLVSVTRLKKQKYFYRNTSDINFDLILSQYTQVITSGAHLEHHLFILKQYIYCDFWNTKAYDIIDSGWDNRDVVEFSEQIIESFRSLESRLIGNLKKETSLDVVDKIKERWEKMNSGELFTIPFNIRSIDEFTGNGFYPGELTIIAARPGMGKTSVSLIIAKNASFINKKKILFFSLEMDKVKLIGRLACQDLDIPYKDFRQGTLSATDLFRIIDWVKEFLKNQLLIIIDDCRTLYSIVSKIKELKPDAAFIDYLQLIKLDSSMHERKIGNREQEVSQISKTLKAITLEENIPVIALSQLSRKVEERGNKMPLLSDLRESGSLEQDADNVIFFLREAYYKALRKEYVPEHEHGNLDISIAKGREWGLDIFKTHIDFKKNMLYDGYKYSDDIFEESLIPKPP